MVDFVPFPGLAGTDNNTTYQANSVVTTANGGTVIAATSMVVYPATGFVGLGTTIPAARLDVYSGNAQLSGTGQSLRGDFSNATLASRTQITTTTTNGNTTVPIVPNGTGVAGGLSLHNASDPGNSAFLNIFATTGATRISSGTQGTGTSVPMEFYTGGSQRLTITTQGNVFIPQSVGIGTSTSAGLFGTGTSNLYVYGNVFISNSGTTGSGVVYPDGTRQTTAAVLPVSYGPVNTIQVAGSSNNFVGDGSLFVWDNTNKRLGIGTSTPAYQMSLYGTDYVLFNSRPGAAARQEIVVGNVVTYGAVLGYDPSIGQSIGYLRRGDSSATTPALSWSYVSSSYRIGVNGITQPQNTMDIAGAVAIGSSYSGANVMSNTNGLSVQGLVGIGTFTPFASLDIFANNSTAGATASHVMLRNGTGSQTVTGYQFAGTIKATQRVDSGGGTIWNSGNNSFYWNNESIGGGTAGTANFYTTANFMNVSGAAVTFLSTVTMSQATGGQISMGGATSNWIAWNTSGVAAPTFTTSSAGTKLLLYPSVSASSVDYAIGIESSTLWNSVQTTGQQFKWYGGTTQAMLLSGAGVLTVTSTAQATGLGVNVAPTATAGEVKATGTHYSGSLTGNGQYVAVQGAASTWYSAMWRNDGSNVYFLSSAVQTTQAAAYTASWNGFRPFSWNLSTGQVLIDGGGVGNVGGVSIPAGSYLGVGATGSGTAGSIIATNEITAYSSDGRLKENVEPIADPIGKVMRLRGVTFDWKDSTKDVGFEPAYRHDVGVIAQEVKAVLPEAIRPAPFDFDKDSETKSKSGEHYLTVQYEKLTALLIEAVKAQQATITDLESRVRTLEGGDAIV